MNGLEALEEIKRDMEYVTRLDYVEPIVRGEVRDNLSKIYHRELPQLDQIERELKALEIIKDLCNLKVYKNKLGQCFLEGTNILFPIPQKTYELLKEVLKC